MRVKLKSKTGVGLLGVAVLVVLVVGGLLSYLHFRNTLPDNAAASVNGVIITKAEVANRIRVARGLDPQHVPKEGTSGYNNFQRDVTSQLVSEELEKQAAVKRNVKVSSQEVDQKFSQWVDQQFLGSTQKMQEYLNSRSLTVNDIKQQIWLEGISARLYDSFRPQATISDAELRAQYQANLSSYVYPEKRQVREIVVASQDEANSVESQLQSGADFATLAKQVSIDGTTQKNGGMVGLVPQSSLPQKVGEVAFSLPEGQVSAPFQGDQGWYVVKVEFVEPASNQTFDQVKDKLRLYATNEKVAKLYKKFTDQIRSSADIQFADDYHPREVTTSPAPSGASPTTGQTNTTGQASTNQGP